MRPLDLRVVLIRTIYERNVGATSRAMANMGFNKLILIDPKCEFTIESNKAAASGQQALAERVTYKSWDEFYQHEPRGIQIATTARDGRGRQTEDLETTLVGLTKSHPEVSKETDRPLTIHVLFGPEDHGLEGDDLKYANYCCCLPTYGENPSLNLAQASLLTLFIIRRVFGGERTKLDGQQKARAAQKKPNIFPDETLKAWLTEMNMDLSKRRINVFTVLRRMLLQNAPSEKEFRMLEIVLQQSTRRMREGRKGKSS
ncbi:MAG: methyltransferase [Pseudobdellovibrio sp.]|jgi:tRNA/rRNA methyltransferase|nr:methyltransferase [Pseudobdellovibrio sp.]